MVGCGTNTAETQSKQIAQSTTTDEGTNKQKNFQRPDLEGEVASIDGNKITLKVIKAPERPAGNNQKTQVMIVIKQIQIQIIKINKLLIHSKKDR